MEKMINKVLRERTMSMFSEEWYDKTALIMSDRISKIDTGSVFAVKFEDQEEIEIFSTKDIKDYLLNLNKYRGNFKIIFIIESRGYVDIHDEIKLMLIQNITSMGYGYKGVNDSDLNKIASRYGVVLLNRDFREDYLIEHSDTLIDKGSIPSHIYYYLNNLILVVGVKYSKSKLYNESGYTNEMTQRKFTSYLTEFLTLKGYRFVEQKSGSTRNVIII